AEHLPFEIVPPHADLGRKRRLTLHQRRLPVLLPVEVVLEQLPGFRRERAIPRETVSAPRGSTLIDRRFIGGSDRLRGKWSYPECQRAGARQDQLPAEQELRAPHEHGQSNG